MSDDKIQADISRAARARALLEDPLLVEAFATLDKDLIDRWRVTANAEDRDRVWQAVQIAEKVRHMLGLVIANGRLAQAELDKLIAAQPKAA
jgi:CRISPR/Cas system-associated protein Csm6